METSHSNNPATPTNRRGYSKEEYSAALSFAKFLYDLWQDHFKNEIIDLDKTIYDNEEPTSIN